MDNFSGSDFNTLGEMSRMEYKGFYFSQLSAKFHSIRWKGFSSCNQFEITDGDFSSLTDDEILVKALNSGFLEGRYIDREIKREWHNEHKEPKFFGPLVPTKLELSDFQILSAHTLIEVIIHFINNTDWGDDKDSFISLFDKVRDEFNDVWKKGSIYFLNNDNLLEGEKQIDREVNFYSYFLLIIIPERDKNIIHIQCFGAD